MNAKLKGLKPIVGKSKPTFEQRSALQSMIRSLSPQESIKIIADLSPQYPTAATTAKKHQYILNTDEDEDDLESTSENQAAAFERKKTKLKIMEDRDKEHKKKVIKKIYGRSSSIPNPHTDVPEEAKMRASFQEKGYSIHM